MSPLPRWRHHWRRGRLADPSHTILLLDIHKLVAPGPPRASSPSRASDSGAVPTREASLALDTRAVDLVIPASVKLPQLQVTPTRLHPNGAKLADPSQGADQRWPAPLHPASPVRLRAARTSRSSDTRAKALLATEIIRLERRVALLRKARRIQLANDRFDHAGTAPLQQRAEKWRDAGV